MKNLLDVHDKIDAARRIAESIAMMGAGYSACPDNGGTNIQEVAIRLADKLAKISDALERIRRKSDATDS